MLAGCDSVTPSIVMPSNNSFRTDTESPFLSKTLPCSTANLNKNPAPVSDC